MLLLLLACSEPPDPTFTLGTGLTSFEPLADGNDLDLVYGPQGGWHVDLSLQATGIRPDDLVLRVGADRDGRTVSYPVETILQERFVRETDDGWERLGDRAVFDIEDDLEILDAVIDVWMELELDGTTWTVSRNVTVR